MYKFKTMENKEKVIRKLIEFFKNAESNKTTEERRDTITQTAEEIVKLFDLPVVINWVACSKQMPKEKLGDYMVCLENNAIFKANYSRIGNERWLIVGVGETQNTNPVTYWAELPEPPCL